MKSAVADGLQNKTTKTNTDEKIAICYTISNEKINTTPICFSFLAWTAYHIILLHIVLKELAF